ncbi:UNVERIFIED_CONTAM: hypothetical protein PYX00_004299 [Menopon gallinae]|uniref:Uncharacterized protein n=1 Tax=Menopon gallinae TaxID=328185 RepID=A0AAW2I4P6_9NEOP
MFKSADDTAITERNLKSSANPEPVSSVEEDLRILDRILDDIENLEEDNYDDTMIDRSNYNNNNNNKSSVSSGNANKNNRKNGSGKKEEVQKLVVEKKLTATEQVTVHGIDLYGGGGVGGGHPHGPKKPFTHNLPTNNTTI